MPRIKCHYVDCVFLDDGYCSAAAVELDPDSGCATFSPSDTAAGDWAEKEETEWEDEETEEGEDDLWEDDEEDEF